MSVTVRIGLEKGENLKFPRFVAHGPVHDHVDKKGYEATTGIGPDLMQASKDAVRGMIDRLCKVHGISAAQAYMLCSVASDPTTGCVKSPYRPHNRANQAAIIDRP